MMTWDEFRVKLDKICENSNCPDIPRVILDEFGSWDSLAFGILEMILYDRMKYNDISFACSGEREYGYNVIDAKSLDIRLMEFKKDFK